MKNYKGFTTIYVEIKLWVLGFRFWGVLGFGFWVVNLLTQHPTPETHNP
jgi:hypothetical protein